MNNLSIKTGAQLTQKEIDDVNKAKNREWQLLPMSKHQLSISLYFLLKDKKDEILAQGQVITIDPFTFANEKFTVLGIGGIIANIKRKGYGKQLMIRIINYLVKNKMTGVGFCKEEVCEFYKKCGFTIILGLQKRFVYINKNGKKIHNTTEDNVFYFEGKDKFIAKVLKEKNKEVLLPRTPDW